MRHDLQRKTVRVLTIISVPLAAFLAFSIQPLMGKHLLPVYGGTVGTWLGTMLFFQVALLGGYAWAAWLVHRSKRTQVYATAALGILATIMFRLPAIESDEPGGLLQVLWSLAATTLPAMILLFSVSTLMHAWSRQQQQAVPYYLYAISNIGSLVALFLYPFYIEPWIGISSQSFIWRVAFFTLTSMLIVAGWIQIRATDINDTVAPKFGADEPVQFQDAAIWLALSALTCVGMLGATHHVAVEIGSNPLAWIGPFGIYLLSFTLVFSGFWRSWMTRFCLVMLGVSLVGFMLSKGFTSATVEGIRFWWLLAVTASGSLLGNALLYSRRPAQHYEKFYLILAVGGVVGGLLSSVVIPFVFARPLEFIFVSVALLAIGIFWLVARREVAIIATLSPIIIAPFLGIGLHQDVTTKPAGATLHHVRDLYGHSMLTLTNTSAVLSSETTTHGSQLTSDAASRRRPTLYYTESTGVGRVIEKFQAQRPSMNVGIVGLGAGTLAAYARPGDHYDFWDIDPKPIRFAQEYFSYLKDAPPGTINVLQRDGRMGVKSATVDYDIIVIDAFSGDGIPPHLVTLEAMTLYAKKLAPRHGLLLVHTTSRYSQILPVVEATSHKLGKVAINVRTEISESGVNRDWDPTTTEYIIVCPATQADNISAWFANEEDNGRVHHILQRNIRSSYDETLVWTDDRQSILVSTDLQKYLFQ